MTIFTPAKPVTIKKLLKNLLILIGIIALVILIDWLFKTNLVRPDYYYAIAGLLLVRIGDFLLTNRVKQVSFDAGKREIIVEMKSIFSGERTKRLSFDNARFEAIEVRAPKNWRLRTLYFLINKKEICEVSRSKDGFSSEELTAIRQQAEQFSIPIVNV